MHSFTSNIFVFLRKDHCAKPRIMSNKVRLTTHQLLIIQLRWKLHHVMTEQKSNSSKKQYMYENAYFLDIFYIAYSSGFVYVEDLQAISLFACCHSLHLCKFAF
ncbi:hypothetical protein V1477_009025 [Vespula maculifrons]|uniref:Uncharacterized protein n=1 Tax=Vespula maculifrons TaxID=7453 RepID=A0ABD2CER7_VESMC